MADDLPRTPFARRRRALGFGSESVNQFFELACRRGDYVKRILASQIRRVWIHADPHSSCELPAHQMRLGYGMMRQKLILQAPTTRMGACPRPPNSTAS